MRARAGFRMALEAEGWCVGQCDALVGLIEQRTVADLHICRQSAFIDCEAVVLRGNQYPLGFQMDDRMIGAMLAEFHFQGLCADGQSQ